MRELLTEMAVELGEEDPKVNLEYFVRLFVNHRSVYDIERTNFEDVGQAVSRNCCSSFVVAGVRNARHHWKQLTAQPEAHRGARW